MRSVYFLDLKPDPELIAAYDAWHKQVWPEIELTFRQDGIESIQIYRAGNRLVMLLETASDFSAEVKAARDAANPKVEAWENLMWTFQQSLPFAPLGTKWVLASEIYSWYK